MLTRVNLLDRIYIPKIDLALGRTIDTIYILKSPTEDAFEDQVYSIPLDNEDKNWN